MMVYMYSKTETIDDGERKERQGAERNELEIRYDRYRGILKNLTLMSDVFMRNVFKERECTEYVLQVIMGRKDLKITDQVLQKDYKNLQGRSAILDCVAQDGDGRQFDVEIQQDTELGRLMHDFHCKDAEQMNSEILARRVCELKETQEGVEFMCREMDAIYHEGEIRGEKRGRIEGHREGREEKAKEMAHSLAGMGMPAEQIAEAAKVSVNLVKKWLSGSRKGAE